MKRTCDSPRNGDVSSNDGKDEYKETQKSTISTMMYTFGDAMEPLKESIELMYVILREQMNLLLVEAEKAAELRNSHEITHGEILFIMRKNKAKLRHLLQYLQILDSKPSLTAVEKENDFENGSHAKNKRLEMCMEFLTTIEDCGEFTSVLEDEFILPEYMKKRLERRLSMIESMKSNEYQEFSKALQVSFYQKRDEFKTWLLQDGITECNLSKLAVTIISFLARETIAEVVDKALLIKSNKLKGMPCYDSLNNPFSMKMKPKEQKFHTVKHLVSISEKEVCVIFNVKETDNDIVAKNSENLNDNTDQFSNVSSPEECNNTSNTLAYERKMDFSEIETDNTVAKNSENLNNDNTDQFSDVSSEECNNPSNTLACERKMDCSEIEGRWESSTTNSIQYSDSNESENFTRNSGEKEFSSNSNSDSNYVEVIEDSNSGKRSEETSLCGNSPRNTFYNVISDTSNNPENVVSSSVHKNETICNNSYCPKSSNESSSTINAIKNGDKSDITSLNKEFLNQKGMKPSEVREAITPSEIREAFAQFNKISPFAYFFSNHPVRLKKKFCIAESYENF